jgi:hypothetical protein
MDIEVVLLDIGKSALESDLSRSVDHSWIFHGMKYSHVGSKEGADILHVEGTVCPISFVRAVLVSYLPFCAYSYFLSNIEGDKVSPRTTTHLSWNHV